MPQIYRLNLSSTFTNRALIFNWTSALIIGVSHVISQSQMPFRALCICSTNVIIFITSENVQ